MIRDTTRCAPSPRGRHQLARRIFPRPAGELRQRYREGQEDQLGELRRLGRQVQDEDVARLSPLAFQYINFLGRYAFNLPEPGRLRSLRDPDDNDGEDDEAVA